MAKKKKNTMRNIILTALIILVVGTGLFFLFGRAPTGGTGLERFTIYDDFKTGKRNDLWNFQGIDKNSFKANLNTLTNVANGNLFVFEQFPCNIQKGGGWGFGLVTSKTLWVNEDLAIKLKARKQTVRCGNFDRPPRYEPLLKFGTTVIPLDIPFKSCNPCKSGRVELFEGNFIILIERNDALDPTKFDVIVNGKKVVSGVNKEGIPLIFEGGNFEIEEVRFRPFFSCEIDRNTEVVARRRFDSNSNINVSQLLFFDERFSKFCPVDLGVLIFDNKGLKNAKGSITDKIARGKNIRVPANQQYEVQYVTLFREGMGDKFCKIGSFFSENKVKCLQTVREDLSKTINQPNITIIKEGENSFVFNSKIFLEIAEREWEITSFDVLRNKPECTIVEDTFLSPSKKGCYKIGVKWDRYEFDVLNGEEKKIDDFLSVRYELTGSGVFLGTRDNKFFDYEFVPGLSRDNNFKITLRNLFDITIDIKPKDQVAELNKRKLFCVNVENRLWDLVNSGYNIKVKKKISILNPPTQRVNLLMKKGNVKLCIEAPTDTLGLISTQSLLFFNVIDNREYISNKLIDIPYAVVSPGQGPTPDPTGGGITPLLIVIGVLFVALGAMIIFFLRRGKKSSK